ncbi:class I SAM-dependent methyltransferase [Halosegnis marinus]|uniref:Class I SAM-dependent methyltransferase n=1 Tax=Halosegnis marinus TaxID=3034023 RepID=A0ABD5ZMM6_9EURY|nr:methyltransferase domain-containing protein [Halosegnis sp. DT85]
MRRFTAEYLDRTREGLWADRDALAPLALPERTSVLDVGCGTGELAAAMAAECPGRVVGADRDPDLLAALPEEVEGVRADAYSLPFPDDSFDLVACQALLVNLPDPERALREFARVARDAVAAIEPDNAGVTVESTAEGEAGLAREARDRYLAGVETDVALGGDLPALFERAGLPAPETARRDHTRTTTAPYAERELEAVARKARGDAIRDRRGEMAGDDAELDALRERWREMGREAVAQAREGTYERRETVPFHVAVADLSDA